MWRWYTSSPRHQILNHNRHAQPVHDLYLNPIPGPSSLTVGHFTAAAAAVAAAVSLPNQDSGFRRVAVLGTTNPLHVSQLSPEDDLIDMFADVEDDNLRRDFGNWN